MYVPGQGKGVVGQVEFSKLEGKEHELFNQSRLKEFESLLANKAVKVLSIAESEEFLRDRPEHCVEVALRGPIQTSRDQSGGTPGGEGRGC